MARIRTTCPTCGGVDVTPSAVTAQVALPAIECTYRFRCPGCSAMVRRGCAPFTVDQLVGCGVHLVILTSPAELAERRPGPPLTHADLVRFCALLADDGAVAAAVDGLGADR